MRFSNVVVTARTLDERRKADSVFRMNEFAADVLWYHNTQVIGRRCLFNIMNWCNVYSGAVNLHICMYTSNNSRKQQLIWTERARELNFPSDVRVSRMCPSHSQPLGSDWPLQLKITLFVCVCVFRVRWQVAQRISEKKVGSMCTRAWYGIRHIFVFNARNDIALYATIWFILSMKLIFFEALTNSWIGLLRSTNCHNKFYCHFSQLSSNCWLWLLLLFIWHNFGDKHKNISKCIK